MGDILRNVNVPKYENTMEKSNQWEGIRKFSFLYEDLLVWGNRKEMQPEGCLVWCLKIVEGNITKMLDVQKQVNTMQKQ